MASAGPASVHPVVKPGDTIFLRWFELCVLLIAFQVPYMGLTKNY